MPWIKRYLPRTLMGRSLLIIVTPLLLLELVTTIVFYDRHWDTITHRLASTLSGDVAMIVAYAEEYPDPEHRAWLVRTAADTMAIRVRFEPGAQLQKLVPPPVHDELDTMLVPLLSERVVHPFQVDTTEIDRNIEFRIQMPDGVLTATTTEKRLFSPTTTIFILWMAGSSVVLVAIAILFMRNQVRPVKRLAAAADDFGKGRDAPEFRPAGATEVRQAAAAFMNMRDRIKRQIEQRTEMLAGVSHDLRTPLTRMKLQLAMVGDGPEIDELKADVTEMERMIDGYLAFARGEGDGVPEAADIGAVLDQVIAGARKQGAKIDLHTEEQLIVPVRLDAFRRCLMNLVSNATRYSRHVQVRAGRRDDQVEILIDDDGPGIPPDQREAVFRPFFRLDPSRNIETGGVGLGLTIARDVMRSHGGELTLDDSPLGGLRARLRLPV
ncbi:MAG TPA: ATP-binding protein [Alphaproteobacteria bacterium]|nr:ATP-binding protein [Alphaproteobacteria bacterium]